MGEKDRSGADRHPIRRAGSVAGTALIALVLLTACGGTAPSATVAPTRSPALPPTTSPATATPTTARPATPTDPTLGTPIGTPGARPPGTPPGGNMDLPEVVRLAVAQMARDLGIVEATIAVVSYERTDWPDSSLGCPEPGKAYLTVITPGYRVFLRANDRQYEYHTNEKNMVVRCPK